MKVYTEILKKFIPHLSSTGVVHDALIGHAFEVEEIIHAKNGDVLDLKVLPDRAHDCLSHRGVAREIAMLTNVDFEEVPSIDTFTPTGTAARIPVRVVSDLCHRYMAMRIDNVCMDTSPTWLIDAFAALGQKSINTCVDLTNYVLQELGQPMHVFDADKIEGSIVVRQAIDGERMTTLDNKEVVLTKDMLVIADDVGVLALAGVKGGKKAEVDVHTKSIIVECANFDAVTTRKAAFKTGIRTDASKRFENNYPSVWAEVALKRYVYLLQKIQPSIMYGEVFDSNPVKEESFTVQVTLARTNAWLGTSLTIDTMSNILTRLHLPHTEADGVFSVTCDSNLFNIREVAERAYVPYQIMGHVGRVIGYEKGIVPVEYVPLKTRGKVIPSIAECDRIRQVLVGRGFIEVRTYHFQNQGIEELENPLAQDKKFIRHSLMAGMQESLSKAVYHAPLTGRADAMIFEIGTVVTGDGEMIHLCLGQQYTNAKQQKKTQEELRTILTELGFDTKNILISTDNALECFVMLHTGVPEPTEEYTAHITRHAGSVWKSLSVYPHMVRDVAFFVGDNAQKQDLQTVISLWAAPLCVRVDMFDEFTKTLEDGSKKLSQAYRLVFQSQERTLTDEEVSVCMKHVEDELCALGCEIR